MTKQFPYNRILISIKLDNYDDQTGSLKGWKLAMSYYQTNCVGTEVANFPDVRGECVRIDIVESVFSDSVASLIHRSRISPPDYQWREEWYWWASGHSQWVIPSTLFGPQIFVTSIWEDGGAQDRWHFHPWAPRSGYIFLHPDGIVCSFGAPPSSRPLLWFWWPTFLHIFWPTYLVFGPGE